jgi:hypothetical protein
MELAFLLLTLVFIENTLFVAIARSTLVMYAVLLPLLALQHFDRKGVVVVLVGGLVLAGVAWASSLALRGRVLAVAEEIRKYATENEESSSGYRLEYCKKSIRFIAHARRYLATAQAPSRICFDKPHRGAAGHLVLSRTSLTTRPL